LLPNQYEESIRHARWFQYSRTGTEKNFPLDTHSFAVFYQQLISPKVQLPPKDGLTLFQKHQQYPMRQYDEP
jgi:hypothetical protein